MGRQKKNLKSKRTKDSPLKELNEMEASKLSAIEFKRMVIRMLKELTDNYKELSENYKSMKRKIETINKNQQEMTNTISEIKNTLAGITNRLDEAEDRVSELEDKSRKKQPGRAAARKKTQKIFRQLKGTAGQPETQKHSNHRTTRRRRKGARIETLSDKIMTDNFMNLKRGKKHTSSGSTEGPNQNEPKEPYSDTS